jgi:hypothetical protein
MQYFKTVYGTLKFNATNPNMPVVTAHAQLFSPECMQTTQH